jgi:putative ABC transport system permease protein
MINPNLIQRLLASLRRRRLDSDLENEIQSHLELAERDMIAQGASPEDARAAARRSFGGVAQMQEEHRDVRTIRWVETALRDLRLGVASLRRNPTFTIVAIGVLALGIGANTAMYSLLDAVLLRPLPFPEPERMVKVWETPSPGIHNSVNAADFLDWKRMNTVFEALSAESPTTATLTGQGEPERLPGKLVSADYFDVFAVKAQLGRTFAPGEDQPGAEPLVLLSNGAWRTRFGADPGILNRHLVLDGQRHRVVGVLPKGAFDRETAKFWKPLVFTPEQRTRGFHWLVVSGRLRSGATLQQAQQEMLAIDARLTELSPTWKRNWAVAVEPFTFLLVGDTLRRSIFVAFGAVVMVLLIACANVTSLLLARGATRNKEMAVRTALGASRGRLVAQMLTETLVLCLAGGVAGVALAQLLLRAALPLFGDSLPFTAELGLDPRVLAFAAAAVLGMTLVIGLVPALRVSNGISASLNHASRGSSRSHEGLRRMIVTAEVAGSLVLICGALLLLKSLFNIQAVHPGVQLGNIITMSVELPLAAYPTPERATQFFRGVTQRLRATPGIEDASVASDPPLLRVKEGVAVLTMAFDKSMDVRYKRVGPEYFRTAGISIVSGRGFGAQDGIQVPKVAIINQALAAKLTTLFGFENPVGRTLRLVTPHWVKLEASLVETQIVGIIRSELTGNPRTPEDPIAYVPFEQNPQRSASFIVRTTGDPIALAPEIRKAVRELDPEIALGDLRSIQQIRQQSLSGATQPAWLIGSFALVAVLLAVLGLYGVLSHAVIQQRKEIGIRLALGATPGNVVSHILRDALFMVVVGLSLGLAGALALTRLMKGLLFQAPKLDPSVLTIGCVAMGMISLLAAFIPATRASRIDPVNALREDG